MHKNCQLEKVCSHLIYYVSQLQVHNVTVALSRPHCSAYYFDFEKGKYSGDCCIQ